MCGQRPRKGQAIFLVLRVFRYGAAQSRDRCLWIPFARGSLCRVEPRCRLSAAEVVVAVSEGASAGEGGDGNPDENRQQDQLPVHEARPSPRLTRQAPAGYQRAAAGGAAQRILGNHHDDTFSSK
jgi:hypothetical protein